MLWASAASVLLAGLLIGATGIGGMLVVPALHHAQQVPLPQAIAAASLGFAFPGLAAAWRLRAAGSAVPSWVLPLALAALPGAALGAVLVHRMATSGLVAGLAVLTLASGLWGLRHRPVHTEGRALPTWALLLIGAAVGLGSALTGTGGPVLLLPLLMLAGQSLRHIGPAVQAIQLPVALCAAAGHALAGALDWTLAGVVGLVLVAGWAGGQWLAPRLPLLALHRGTCLLLVATGVWLGAPLVL